MKLKKKIKMQARQAREARQAKRVINGIAIGLVVLMLIVMAAYALS